MQIIRSHHFTAIVLILFFYSCNNQKTEKPTIKNSTLNGLSISDIHDQISINLDLMLDSVFFIPLETNKNIVLNDNRHDILINDDAIVVFESASVLLFDKKGKFIKKLLSKGRGPKEFNSIRSPELSKSGIYYSDGQYRDRICFYEFESDSLKFIPRKEGHICDFLMDDNNKMHYIWWSPFSNKHFEAVLYTQNKDAKIIRNHHLGKMHSSQGILGFHKFYNRNNKTFVSTPGIDTIWEINNSTLIPVWTTDIGEPANPEVNKQTYYNAELIEFSQTNVLFYLQQFKKEGKINSGGKRELIFANRATHEIGKVSNFLIGGLKISKDFIKIHAQSDNHIIFEISAYKIVEELDKQQLSKNGKYFKQLMDLKKSMQEYDNPLLITGKIPGN